VDEVFGTHRLDAVIYREYLDPGYTVPNMAPLVARDLTVPRWDQRIPGCVLYAEPNERLRVHVRNDDTDPHTFHVHGLVYGIDSDGAWPFGVAAADGRRSDAICPGEEWCYVFDVTMETVGCWPFHDHLMDIQAAVDRGLFGGIVVRHPDGPKPDLEVPFFLHRLVGAGGEPAFDSGTLSGRDTFTHTFPTAGTFDYVCKFHPMLGRVRVNPTGPMTANVSIVDTPTPRFVADDITIGVGGTATWTHGGTMPHAVSDAATAPLDSMAINGRAFVGNTPIVAADTGARIRWYVFNLDLWRTLAQLPPTRPTVPVRRRHGRHAQHRPGRVVLRGHHRAAGHPGPTRLRRPRPGRPPRPRGPRGRRRAPRPRSARRRPAAGRQPRRRRRERAETPPVLPAR